MQATYPSVSVVIPTYNRSRYLRHAVDSVLRQTYPGDMEIIVVDDGSTDDTQEVAKLYSTESKAVRYVRLAGNSGPSVARNTGIACAEGELVAFLDSDDEWLPHKLERQIRVLQERDLDAVYSGWNVIDAEGKLVGKHSPAVRDDVLASAILKSNVIGTASSVVVRRECLLHVGGFDESLWFGEDWDLWIRLIKQKYRFGSVNDSLLLYREHTLGVRLTNDLERALVGMRRIRDKWPEYGVGEIPSEVLLTLAGLELRVGDFPYGRRLIIKQLITFHWSWAAAIRLMLSFAGPTVYRWLASRPWRRLKNRLG